MYRIILFCILSWAITLIGCGPRMPQLAEVEGTVSKGGKNLDDVDVQFLPDPERDNKSPMSSGITDNNGRYVQKYLENGKDGAAVGWHRVILIDNRVYDRDNPQPSRFDYKFNLAASTPIKVEVKPGKQTIDINIDDYR